MAGVNTAILATDYNTIQSNVNSILGIGSGDYGYGQTVTSSQVARTNRITVAQWNALRTDLLKARNHQTSVDESGALSIASTTTRIREADRLAYSTFSNLITTNRLVTPPSSQASLTTLQTVTRTAPWATTISHEVTITFASEDNSRFFFNSGSSIKFSSSMTGYSAGVSLLVNQSWATLLANMGIISFNAYSTTSSGTGTSQAIGFYNLTTTNQLVFTKLVEAGNQYTPNQYQLYVRKSGNSVIFTPTWSYVEDGNYGFFEPADGTLTSLVQAYTATGLNVSVTAPTSSTTNL
jgi:hypothetical protein